MKTGTFVMLRKKNNDDFVCFMLFFQFSRECGFLIISFNKYFSGARYLYASKIASKAERSLNKS